MAVLHDLEQHDLLATNNDHPLRVATGTVVRHQTRGDAPVTDHTAATGTPDAPAGRFIASTFYRDRGDGKNQFCVQFPSGAVQILCTEP